MKLLLVGKNSSQASPRRHKKRAGRDQSPQTVSARSLLLAPPLALRQGAVVALLTVQRPENVGEHFFLGCGGLEVHGIP